MGGELKCEISGCENAPHAAYQWSGQLPMQTATLCERHGDELWQRLNGLVQTNRATFRIGMPGTMRPQPTGV
jgi:hypothetical protein